MHGHDPQSRSAITIALDNVPRLHVLHTGTSTIERRPILWLRTSAVSKERTHARVSNAEHELRSYRRTWQIGKSRWASGGAQIVLGLGSLHSGTPGFKACHAARVAPCSWEHSDIVVSTSRALQCPHSTRAKIGMPGLYCCYIAQWTFPCNCRSWPALFAVVQQQMLPHDRDCHSSGSQVTSLRLRRPGDAAGRAWVTRLARSGYA